MRYEAAAMHEASQNMNRAASRNEETARTMASAVDRFENAVREMRDMEFRIAQLLERVECIRDDGGNAEWLNDRDAPPVSIIEEIEKRRREAPDEGMALDARRNELLVKIATLTELLDAVDGSGDAESTPRAPRSTRPITPTAGRLEKPPRVAGKWRTGPTDASRTARAVTGVAGAEKEPMLNSLPLVMGVDPGPEESSYVVWDGKAIVDKFSGTNGDLLWLLRSSGRLPTGMEAVVFEKIVSYGMAVGREVFETVFQTGRLYQQADRAQHNVVLMPRREVKMHLCGQARAKDTNIRIAILDRMGGKRAAVGLKKTPGPLYGIKSHQWSALAIAITWFDKNIAKELTEKSPPAPRED